MGTKLGKKIVRSVGLSYSLQSHREEDKNLHYNYRNTFEIKHNIRTNETRISCKSISLLPKKKEQNRGVRSGKVFQKGLTTQAKHKIQKACRILEGVYKHEEDLKAYCSMLTLSYGKNFPTDHESKKHLDTFLKRLRRVHPNCKYVWVAEKQKRGAIHYHILTPYYTKKEWLNNAWNNIVQEWQKTNNYQIQEVLPNVIKVNSASSYLAKYIQKNEQNIGGNGYGIDQKTRELMKDEAIYFIQHDLEPEQVNEVISVMEEKITNKEDIKHKWTSKYSSYNGFWSSGLNVLGLKEFIKYNRHDFDLMTEEEQGTKRRTILKEVINSH